MKKTLCILLIFLTASITASAQHSSTQSIIDDINTKKFGQGNVTILQDETVDDRLAQYHVNTDTANVIRLSDERANGFKVQVFSGNNQQKSRNEAEYKQSLIREEYPQHQAQVSYDPPNWRLRVGNFLTRADAEELVKQMKITFPAFGKEMYVVSDIVRRPLRR